MIKFLDLKKQYDTIKPEVDAAIAAVVGEAAFVGSRFVDAFECEFAAYVGASHVVGVGNGTDALEIALEALALPRASQVLVPANTFIATAEAVTRAGHEVVFCDVDPATLTICPDDMQKRITPRTAAIIPVHLYGHPADMDPILAIARAHGLKVIEDASQAHAATYLARHVGVFGDVAAFSFYPGKNLGAFGDAGAIVTANEALADKCRMIANHGRKDKYEHEFEGRNSRLDGIQAAVLSVKLKHLNAWIRRRRQVAGIYDDTLAGISGIALPKVANWAKHAYHLYVVRTKKRDALKRFLAERGIETGVHYPVALPRLKAYAHLRTGSPTPYADKLGDEVLSLPIGEHLSDADAAFVAQAVRSFFTAEKS